MLADHPPGITPGGPGLSPETRGIARKPQGQDCAVENLAGNDIGQRHLGGRDQPAIISGVVNDPPPIPIIEDKNPIQDP